MRKPAFAVAAALVFVTIGASAQPPAPQPFPTTNGPSTAPPSRQQPPPPASASPARSQAQPPATTAPNGQPDQNADLAAKLGVPVYPSAQLLGSYDAGRGQTFYLFGSTAAFNDLVAYYKSVLKQGGHMVFDAPATYSFEVGKFDEDTMAFPPGVTIKDFQSEPTGGYPNPKPGGQPAVFPSVIQIVTAPAPAPAPPAGR
ncbi:MAG TPA: hypothetical protein VIC33_10670 [Vicinamibacterales bacterium]|jgi:hypothetical protein